jgi:hypothetical protein
VPDTSPRPPYLPADRLTPERHITHTHFTPTDRIMIISGVVNGRLSGDVMTVVAPSWHTPTDEDGWRLRNPNGGARTFITGHPRYLVHLNRRCADCLIYLRAMEDYLLPRFPGPGPVNFGWYHVTALNQLVHIADIR